MILAIIQLTSVWFPSTPPFVNSLMLVDEMEPQSRFICNRIKIISFKHTSINFSAVLGIIIGTILIAMLSFADSWVVL